MLWVPKRGTLRVQHNVGSTGTGTPGTAATSGAINTKGSYTQLFASTNFDVYLMCLYFHDVAIGATATAGLVDIAIGAATEEIIIPDLLVGGSAGPQSHNTLNGRAYWFPFYIAAGTKISFRHGNVGASRNAWLACYLFGGDGYPPFRVATKVTAYGISGVLGTAITPGNSGVEGSWTQISASSSIDHFGILPSFMGNNAAQNTRDYYVDIGVGGAGAEQEIAQSYIFQTDATETESGPNPPLPTFVDIPAATRLSMRASNSVATSATGFTASLYGLS